MNGSSLIVIILMLLQGCLSSPKIIINCDTDYISRMQIAHDEENYDEVISLGDTALFCVKTADDSCTVLSLLTNALERNNGGVSNAHIVETFYDLCLPSVKNFWFPNSMSRLHHNDDNYDSALFYIDSALKNYNPEINPVKREWIIGDKMSIYHSMKDYENLCFVALNELNDSLLQTLTIEDESGRTLSLKEFCK